MTVYLVTGVNRGIGLAFVDQLSQDESNTVIGTVRNLKNAQSILDLKRSNIHLIELDFLADIETFEAAFKNIDDIAPKGLDVVIHNAGVVGAQNVAPVMEYKADDYRLPFEVNVIGSVKLYQTIVPYLYKGEGHKTLAFISSVAGQITGSQMTLNGYGASKAALNYFMRQAHLENQSSDNKVRKESTVFSVHPGLVDTDSAQDAIRIVGKFVEGLPVITAAESVASILSYLPNAKSGTFINNDGTVFDF